MREIKGAVFDADGTLFDSMGLWDRAGEIYLRRKGIRPGEDTKEQLETMTMEESAEYFRSSYGIRLERDEIIDEFNRMIYDCYEKVIRIKPGVLQVLEDLKSRNVRMCIATSTDRPLIEAALKNNGIDGYFTGLLTCTEAGAGKRNPRIYELAMGILGTKKEETLVFEDAYFAAETAKKYGITKTALIIVGEVVLHQDYERSRLYDPSFTTEYRKAGHPWNQQEAGDGKD